MQECRAESPINSGEIFYAALLQHGHFDPMPFGGFDRDLVPRIRVADDAHTGIGCQDSFKPAGSFGCAIGHNDLACVLAVSHPHSPTVMKRDPGCATDRVD